jgi:uncharacterized protein (UPF0210 family)
MKIRSITYFCDPKFPLDERVLQRGGQFLTEARFAYEAAGYEVQTTRLATIPFPELLGEENMGALPALTSQLDSVAQALSIGYVSLGPALPEFPSSYAVIPEAIFVSKIVFFGGVMADKKRGLDVAAARACADVIVRCASIEPNGFANLQFAALANVEAVTPFLPAAYHNRDEPVFAIATESADLAVQAVESANSLDEARENLVREIQGHGKRLTQVAKSLKCKFGGIDFSLAPFPSEAQSLGTAFEKLGVPKIGLHGSLLAAAILTEAIDRADFLHTGFSGLMMPVLEDVTLAKRAAEGTLTVKDLLLYSAVCGTGLDTIPLPGDTTSEQLVPLLLDLCALALRLDKPLTARLMPVPGKKAGEATSFDFAFFAQSQVMKLESEPLKHPFAESESFWLQARHQQI